MPILASKSSRLYALPARVKSFSHRYWSGLYSALYKKFPYKEDKFNILWEVSMAKEQLLDVTKHIKNKGQELGFLIHSCALKNSNFHPLPEIRGSFFFFLGGGGGGGGVLWGSEISILSLKLADTIYIYICIPPLKKLFWISNT